MPAKHTTHISWTSEEEIEEAKAKAKRYGWKLSNLIREAIKAFPDPQK